MAKALAEIYPEKPKPKEETHRFETGIGFCPTCEKIETREPDKLEKHLPKIRDYLRGQTKDRNYVCETCGYGLGNSAEEVSAIDNCPWCNSSKAIKRELYEEKQKR